jgi:hypothetical protein
MKRCFFFVLTAALFVAGCRYQRLPADLQSKLDSVHQLEKIEYLRLQGFHQEEGSPMQQLYDSLAIQPLPLKYSEFFITQLPNMVEIPEALAELMGFRNHHEPRLIALPETVSLRVVLLADKESDGTSLWLYTLDSDCSPVDRLCIYQPRPFKMPDGKLVHVEYAMTSDYTVCLSVYTTDHKVQRKRIYTIDESLHFQELE